MKQMDKYIPMSDVVARDCFDRVLAENDVMREQLVTIGKKPGDDMSDVAIVVRCKDCECWERDWTTKVPDDGSHLCVHVDHYTSPDDFCSDGERKNK